MNDPIVTCVMLTADQPGMARQAVDFFVKQNYENKRLVIWDTGSERLEQFGPQIPLAWDGILQPDVDSSLRGASIGTLRNFANKFAAHHYRTDPPEIICHFDHDDWSHTNRITEQVELLQSTGADVVGYNEWLVWNCRECDALGCQDQNPHGADGTGAWLYKFPLARLARQYAFGATMAYWRKTWERKPFPKKNDEDTEWQLGLNVRGISSLQDCNDLQPQKHILHQGYDPRFIARYHGQNAGSGWRGLFKHPETAVGLTRVPMWDKFCRERFS